MLFFTRVLKIVLPALVVGGLFWAWVERQALYDWWQLRGYTAPAEIAQLAKQDTMTPLGKHDFYVNHPQLMSDKAAFQQACSQTEQTIVLGCYKGDQQGINIFAVSDKRLSGVEQVTAAHEMLHSAYDRLSKNDRDQVEGWLQDYYQHDLKDKRIIETIASYRKTEPNDVLNEMHSVFGTEIPNLPAKLENYYKRYFANRNKVVDYSNQYESAFTSRENQAKALYGQLQSLATQIKNLEATLSTERAGLDADRGGIHSQAEADAYNARVRSYNAQVGTLNSLVNQYNTLRDQYNNLVLQQQDLLKAIDTRSFQTAPAQ